MTHDSRVTRWALLFLFHVRFYLRVHRLRGAASPAFEGGDELGESVEDGVVAVAGGQIEQLVDGVIQAIGGQSRRRCGRSSNM